MVSLHIIELIAQKKHIVDTQTMYEQIPVFKANEWSRHGRRRSTKQPVSMLHTGTSGYGAVMEACKTPSYAPW
jgi:hypothetical protein